MVFSGDRILRSHLRMNGRWDIYRPGEAWRRSPVNARVVIGTDAYVAVGFNLSDIAFHTGRTLGRESPISGLGPDLLRDDFDEGVAVERLRARPDLPIAMALLDQRRLAGIGNVYKSETLFLCGIHPFQPVSQLSDDQLQATVRRARALMQANVSDAATGHIVTYRGLRSTTGRFNARERLWVYRRRGLACRKCGTAIAAAKMGEEARSTYWCPQCQRVDPALGR
jgi:endonuclease-8